MKRRVFLKSEDNSNKKTGIKQFLNKDIKEFNIIILSLLCIGFLIAVGIISYKINFSYALFTDTIKGEKTIELTVSSNAVYSWSTDYVYAGATKSSISGWTTDYTTLGKNYFLKHNLASDDIVESQEVCYLLNNNLYCLIGSAASYFEENSSILLSSFGENNCSISDGDYVSCSLSGIEAYVNFQGYVHVFDDNGHCYGLENNSAYCKIGNSGEAEDPI